MFVFEVPRQRARLAGAGTTEGRWMAYLAAGIAIVPQPQHMTDLAQRSPSAGGMPVGGLICSRQALG